MNLKNTTSLQKLEFLPLLLIVIFKFGIQTNSSISHQNKMIVLYVFVAISTAIFGYLLMKTKSTTAKSIASLVIIVLLIFVCCYLFYFTK